MIESETILGDCHALFLSSLLFLNHIHIPSLNTWVHIIFLSTSAEIKYVGFVFSMWLEEIDHMSEVSK